MVSGAGAPVSTRATGFNCPSCGASLTLSTAGWSASVVCPTCGSILDAQDPNLRILQRHSDRMLVQPKIPLGTRGTWKGVPWEVVGFQQVTIHVENVPYSWREYVCFNPYQGFFYLTEYDGHWNVVEKLRRRPDDRQADASRLRFDGKEFRHFQSATATTTFAIGEFPWEVNIGDQVRSHDFVAPPYLLSAEVTQGETTWSLGTYTDPRLIAKAFLAGEALGSPVGVFANQPNPHRSGAVKIMRAFALFLAVLFGMVMLTEVLSQKKLVFDATYQLVRSQTDTIAIVTDPFDIGGRVSNLQVNIQTDLDNDWEYFNLALINETTGQALDVGRQVSYYYGRDSDGSWSEGSRNDSFKLGSVLPGRYILRIAPEGGEGAGRVVNYTVRLRRDMPSYTFFVLGFFALMVPAVLSWIPSASFEQRRWAESDHAPSGSGSDDDD